MAWKITDPTMFRPLKKEIYWVSLGTPPNEVVGHEQGFKRPCVVIRSGHPSHLAIVVPMTSQVPPSGHFATVDIPQGVGNLTKDSYALCYQAKAASYLRFGSKIGDMDDDYFEEILAVLSHYMGVR